MPATVEDTLLVIGYGSLMSGFGLLGEARGGRGRLLACEAFPVVLSNARRGLQKPSNHGRYLAMNLEQRDPGQPLTGRSAIQAGPGELGALALRFERRFARQIASREGHDPDQFERLIERAKRRGCALGDWLLDLAEVQHHGLQAYGRALFTATGYVSPGYTFCPLVLDGREAALVAVALDCRPPSDALAGVNGASAPPALVGLGEAAALDGRALDCSAQLDYIVECLLAAVHNISVRDLTAGIEPGAPWSAELQRRLLRAAVGEPALFLKAASLDPERYGKRFGKPDVSVARRFCEPGFPG